MTDSKEFNLANEKIKEPEEKVELLEARLPPKQIFPEVKFLGHQDRKRILITGGAGFVGSHLVDKLMLAGHEVLVADNFFTGQKRNIEHWIGHENFEFLHHDIVNPLFIEVDEIYHLASPASLASLIFPTPNLPSLPMPPPHPPQHSPTGPPGA